MGASASASAEAYNSAVTQMTENCNNTFNIESDAACSVIANNCSHVNVTCGNHVVTKQGCELSQTSSVAQAAISQTVTTAKAGVWGFACSESDSIAVNLVSDTLTQACANAAAISVAITGGNVVCNNTSDINVAFISSYTGSQICYAAQTSKIAQKSTATASATAISFDPTILIAIVVIGLVLIIVALVIGNVVTFNGLFGGGAAGDNINLGKGAKPSKGALRDKAKRTAKANAGLPPPTAILPVPSAPPAVPSAQLPVPSAPPATVNTGGRRGAHSRRRAAYW